MTQEEFNNIKVGQELFTECGLHLIAVKDAEVHDKGDRDEDVWVICNSIHNGVKCPNSLYLCYRNVGELGVVKKEDRKPKPEPEKMKPLTKDEFYELKVGEIFGVNYCSDTYQVILEDAIPSPVEDSGYEINVIVAINTKTGSMLVFSEDEAIEYEIYRK